MVATLLAERGREAHVTLTPAGPRDVFIVASAHGDHDPRRVASGAYEAIAHMLRARGLSIVHERVFGSLSAAPAVLDARRRALGAGTHPTYVQGRPVRGEGIAGISIRATAADRVRTLDGAGGLVRRWRGDGHEYATLQGLDGVDSRAGADNGHEAQLRRLFGRAFAALASAGFGARSVVRTWFYVDRIVERYAAFNRVRDAAFEAAGLLGAGGAALVLPASTAVGCANAAGAAAVLDVLAVDERSACHVEGLSNPVQPEATSYGSAFARARVVRGPCADQLLLSGTAAIGRLGETLSPTDAGAQIRATLDAVRRLLGRHGADLSAVAASTLFFKRPEDHLLFERALQSQGIPPFPYVSIVADICRDDLLFEMDAELVIEHPPENAA